VSRACDIGSAHQIHSRDPSRRRRAGQRASSCPGSRMPGVRHCNRHRGNLPSRDPRTHPCDSSAPTAPRRPIRRNMARCRREGAHTTTSTPRAEQRRRTHRSAAIVVDESRTTPAMSTTRVCGPRSSSDSSRTSTSSSTPMSPVSRIRSTGPADDSAGADPGRSRVSAVCRLRRDSSLRPMVGCMGPPFQRDVTVSATVTLQPDDDRPTRSRHFSGGGCRRLFRLSGWVGVRRSRWHT
jgi:hypothetical protein